MKTRDTIKITILEKKLEFRICQHKQEVVTIGWSSKKDEITILKGGSQPKFKKE